MWLTKLERLADPKYGLTVRFESGWKRRGASGGAQMKAVAGVLWHHDVSPRSGTYPLRNMLKNGRAGLTGPLCHIGFDRDGTVWVVGAGKANHAGTGKVSGVPRNGGNTRLIGIEMTSAGTRPWDWTAAQLRQMPRLGAALSDIFGLSTSQHWAHYEYQNGKIDPAGLPGNMPGLRSRIGAVRFGGISGGGATVPRPSVPADDGLSSGLADVDKAQRSLAALGYDPGPLDGIFGTRTETATRQAQQDLGITPADGRPGPATRTILEDAVSTIDEIKAIVTQNQREIRAVPGRVLDEPVKLAGIDAGKTSSLRTKAAYAAHEHRVTQQQIAALRGELAGAQEVLRAVNSGEPLDLEQVRAAAQEGVSQALGSLEVTVTKGE